MTFDPMQLAKAQAAQYSSSANFLTLKEGEPKVIRMLTGFTPYYIVSHSCGLSNVDVKKSDFDAAIAQNGYFACPKCGERLDMSNVLMERPSVEGAYMHRFVPTSDGKKANLVCIGHPENVKGEYIEGSIDMAGNGVARYDCPICRTVTKDGKPERPSMRIFGVAVERKVQMVQETDQNGITMMVAKGAEDIIEVGDDGVARPKVVIVDLPFNSFWSVLLDKSPDYSLSMSYFDWMVSRTGTGLATKYNISCLNSSAPNPVDFTPYKDLMPDLKAMLKAWGAPKFYVGKGWGIQGYVPEPEEQPAAQQQQPVQYQQQAPQYQQPVSQYQQPVPQFQQTVPQFQQQVPQQQFQPASNDWSQIQGAVR